MSSADQQTLSRHNEALRGLARATAWRSVELHVAFELLTKATSTTLGVDRVSIWLYDGDRSRIECASLYDGRIDRVTSGATLSRADYPAYFAALDENRAIAANDAAADRRTSEFARDYLPEHGIGAMLDAPLFAGGQCVGVVCNEHVGPPRTWTIEEVAFAGSIADFASLALESSHRAAAEAALAEREEELRTALNAARMGTWSWNIQSGALVWSPNVALLFGRPEGWTPDYDGYMASIHPADRTLLQGRIGDALDGIIDEYFVEHRVVWEDGSVHWIEGRGRVIRDPSGQPVVMKGVVANIDERRGLEEQVRRSQRMEGLGRLAGGIAHDFNNMLTVMSVTVAMLDKQLSGSAKVRDHVENLRTSVERASALTSQLLSFARKQPVAPKVIDVNAAVESLAGLLRRLISEEVQLRVELCPDEALIRIDPQQFEQVLINQVVNARDALHEGGTISVQVSRKNDAVVVSVGDTGTGIPDHVLPHVFEPFFTTKAVGDGTGLGLSTCYGIVTQAGGTIEVTETSPKGTVITVRLPSATNAVAEATPPGERTWASGNARILVVEDEQTIHDLLVMVLEQAGYKVVSATHPERAIELAAATPLDAIIADVVMPGMRGPTLVDRIRESHPDIRVLYTSGYTDTEIHDAAFVRKPFTPTDILAELKVLLRGT